MLQANHEAAELTKARLRDKVAALAKNRSTLSAKKKRRELPRLHEAGRRPVTRQRENTNHQV